MTNAVEKIQALRQAQTIGDIFRVDLHQTVHKLERPDEFNKAATPASAFSATAFRADQNGIISPTYESEDPLLSKGFDECLEHVRRTEETGQRHNGTPLSRNFKIEATGWIYGSVCNTANGIHVDNTTDPRSRVYICSTQAPTLSVPNTRALEIIQQFPFAQTLDWKITDDEDFRLKLRLTFFNINTTGQMTYLDGETGADRRELLKTLESALEPVESAALTVASALTFHKQQTENQKNRIFFRSYAYG